MNRKELVSCVESLKKDLNSVEKELKELRDRVRKQEFIIRNPPKFKYGDKVIYTTGHFGAAIIERSYMVLKEIVSNHYCGNYYGEYYRNYECAGDNGIDILLEDNLSPDNK